MKIKALSLALLLATGVAATAFAENNEEASKAFFEQKGVAYVLTGDYVRVRTHPSTLGYIICELRKGEIVKNFTANEEPHQDSEGLKWHYVVMKDGNVGWICTNFIELKK